MQVETFMDKNFPTVELGCSVRDAVAVMIDNKGSYVLVVSQGMLAGILTTKDLLRCIDDICDKPVDSVMTPLSEMEIVEPHMTISEIANLFSVRRVSQIPVVESGKAIGVVTKDFIFNHFCAIEREAIQAKEAENFATSIINSLMEGLVVIDKQAVIRRFNPAAESLTGNRAVDRIGKAAYSISEEDSPAFMVLKTGEALYNQKTQVRGGRTWAVNYVPMVSNGEIQGVIQTFWDITEQTKLEDHLLKTSEELDKAFSLTLPNTNMEAMLKTSPEYMDTYNLDTGRITITDVIPDGGYRHVVNGLRVVADFKEKGLMKVVGLDKDILVTAIVFHDIGKSQPILKVGDEVDPRAVFESSKEHAARSADIAEKFYHKESSVVTLIRYHHHEENELPESFPSHLLPSYRVLRLVDGLSAGITRRNSEMTCEVRGPKVTVTEKSRDPRYNKTFTLDIFTGKTQGH